jgi:cell wall-associated NlpC family hydrolase
VDEQIDRIIMKHIGKRRGIGETVCFDFVRELFLDEFGIELRNDFLILLREFHPIRHPHFGDLVAMKTHPIFVNHIGLYLRTGKFIHCGRTDEVIISDIHDLLYGKRVEGFLRKNDSR